MPIIDSTYFINEILIAGLSNTVDSTGSKLSGFIEKYETRFLKELLGKTLLDEFKSGLEEDPVPVKWVDLKNILANNSTKESPIANYVYYWYMRNKSTETASIGEIKPNTENGSMASSVQKQVRSWNEMVDWNFEVLEFIKDNIIDYPSFNPANGFYHGYGFYRCYHNELFIRQNTLNI